MGLFQVYKALVEKIKSTLRAKVENNKFYVYVHFRCVDENVNWNQICFYYSQEKNGSNQFL